MSTDDSWDEQDVIRGNAPDAPTSADLNEDALAASLASLTGNEHSGWSSTVNSVLATEGKGLDRQTVTVFTVFAVLSVLLFVGGIIYYFL